MTSPTMHPRLPRNRFLRLVRTRPRVFIATLVGLLVYGLLPVEMASHTVTRALIAWNAGACLYVLLAGIMMSRTSPHGLRHRAQLQDEGAWVLLLLVVFSNIASLAAIAAELAVVKDMHGLLRTAHIALAGVTVLSSWAFTQVMFALHYAHDYYADICKGRPPSLQFPGDEPPTYGDFFYFSIVVGTSAQTADVSYASRAMRRTGSLHCILAYLFNTTVLALLINIGAGLF